MPTKGKWIKVREYELSDEGRKALKPQHDRIAETGRLLRENCKGKSGEEFKQCRIDIYELIYGKKAKEE